MLRVVADTNILISAAISEGYEYDLLLVAKMEKIELILSQEILWEFEAVLKRPRFGFSKQQVDSILKQVKDISTIIDPKIKLTIVKDDPDDNKIVECAVAAKADYLISGDRHLLNLNVFEGIKIINAREFLALFSKDK